MIGSATSPSVSHSNSCLGEAIVGAVVGEAVGSAAGELDGEREGLFVGPANQV